MPDSIEAKARRLLDLSKEIRSGAEEIDRLSSEREALMVDLHDAGWNNVLIADAAGLTRARVSTVLKPLLEARAVGQRGLTKVEVEA